MNEEQSENGRLMNVDFWPRRGEAESPIRTFPRKGGKGSMYGEKGASPGADFCEIVLFYSF